MKKKPVTLKTIAKELDLSVTAVSRALRDGDNISEETKNRVKQAVERLNYQPNLIAKSLRINKTKTIGLVISDSSLSFFASLIEGVEKKAKEKGYNIILSNANCDVKNEMEAVQLLAGKRVDGILLAASMLTSKKYKSFLDAIGIPYIYLVRKPEYEKADYIINDNYYGVYEIINYLIKTGSSRIHFINVSNEITTSKYREKGYEEALKNAGIPYNPDLIHNVPPTIEGGYSAMESILKHDKHVNTVYCGCDMIAIGVMEKILENGLRIPDDIRVASYDDIEFAAYLRVPLTTVRQPRRKIGELGAKMLTEKIESSINESGHDTIHIVLKPEIVIRRST